MPSSFAMKNSENVRTNALVHCLAHGGFQPMSPDMASFGVYLSTLMALFWTECRKRLWFHNQSLFFLLNAAFLTEKQQIPILFSLV